jgi:hypothetical protein
MALHQVLQAVSDVDESRRRAAEAALEAAASRPGFAPALAGIAVGQDGAPPALRQLAAVVLKKLVRERWDSSAKHWVGPPVVSDADKEAVRSTLIHGLGDVSSAVRTAVSMAIAAVIESSVDLDSSWPGLLEGLVAAVRARTSEHLGEHVWQVPAASHASPAHGHPVGPPHLLELCMRCCAVHGALRCLSLIASDIDERQLPKASYLRPAASSGSTFPRVLTAGGACTAPGITCYLCG